MPTGVYVRTEYHNKINSEVHKGIPSSMKGKHFSEEVCKKMSVAKRGKYIGENSPFWKGGKRLMWRREHAKRKQFGYISLNNCELDNWEGHHINKEYVIFIPEELHKSIWHSITKDINMNLINDKVYEWFIDYYLKEIKNGI